MFSTNIGQRLIALNRPWLTCWVQSSHPIRLRSTLLSNNDSVNKSINISSTVEVNPKRKTPLVSKFAPLTLTKAAVNRVKQLMSENPKAEGLRIGVRTRGCNGLSYTMEFSFQDKKPGDEVVEQDGIRLFIDRRAQLTLLGTEMDYREELLGSQFVFNNPNVKSTCGCGESFNI